MEKTLSSTITAQDIQTALASRFNADAAVDFQIQLMEQEIAQGWCSYYAAPLWFKQQLPPPLINELGRKHMACWYNIWYAKDKVDEEFMDRMLHHLDPALHHNYRNYLDPIDLNHAEERPYGKRSTYFVDRAIEALAETAWLTPEGSIDQRIGDLRDRFAKEEVTRADAVYSQIDIEQYYYPVKEYIVPPAEMIQKLMPLIAPSWQHVPAMSKKRRLVYARPFLDGWSWALVLDGEGRTGIDRIKWGLVKDKTRGPADEKWFFHIAAGYQVQRAYLKNCKRVLLDDEGYLNRVIWEIGADLMYRIPHFESWMKFFEPIYRDCFKDLFGECHNE